MIGLLFRSRNGSDAEQEFLSKVWARQPRFVEAVVGDAQVTARYRGERSKFRSPLDTLTQVIRLMLVSDAFAGVVAFRMKTSLIARGVPLLPHVCQRLALMMGHVSIGDCVVMHPGVYIPNGQVVIDGLVEIHRGAIISPWTTFGLIGASIIGPSIGPHARIGTGVKVLGEVKVGAHARIAANSVVLSDVPDGATAAGNPAKTVHS